VTDRRRALTSERVVGCAAGLMIWGLVAWVAYGFWIASGNHHLSDADLLDLRKQDFDFICGKLRHDFLHEKDDADLTPREKAIAAVACRNTL
jgi:hypothetical protein